MVATISRCMPRARVDLTGRGFGRGKDEGDLQGVLGEGTLRQIGYSWGVSRKRSCRSRFGSGGTGLSRRSSTDAAYANQSNFLLFPEIALPVRSLVLQQLLVDSHKVLVVLFTDLVSEGSNVRVGKVQTS